MDFKNIKRVYFLGVGGIGMSALARYFVSIGKKVAGYDKTETPLTRELSSLGVTITYKDDVLEIPESFTRKENTLIVLTPAIPKDHNQWKYFQDRAYHISKRAEVLGILFNPQFGVAIAGTHGKTTISTMTAYLLKESGIDCSAFLGGLSKNYNTNLLTGSSDVVVAEADEFDRSFLQLHPNITLVSAMDADHLDIYSDAEDITQTFNDFVDQLKEGGILIHKLGLPVQKRRSIDTFTYSLENKEADFYVADLIYRDLQYHFSLQTPYGKVEGLTLKHPGITNVENAVAALAVRVLIDKNLDANLSAINNFEGIKRRFDILYKDEAVTYMDDYAHHPRELEASINSARKLFPGKKITGVFQPHLFSRTRDFLDEFAASLSLLDELILLDIYPARELPIEGVNSQKLLEKVNLKDKQYCSKENLIPKLKGLNIEVLLTLGAGDIDQFTEPIANLLKNRK